MMWVIFRYSGDYFYREKWDRSVDRCNMVVVLGINRICFGDWVFGGVFY